MKNQENQNIEENFEGLESLIGHRGTAQKRPTL